MNKQEIINILDDLDRYMRNNLNSSHKFNNSSDMYLRIYLDKLEEIQTKKYLANMPIEVIKRFEMTKKAFEDARNEHKPIEYLDMSYAYYQYIDNKRNSDKFGIQNEYDAMDNIRCAVRTHHFPAITALDFTYNGLSLENQIEYSSNLLPRINMIYNDMYEDKGKALTVIKKQTVFSKIVDRIKSIFQTKDLKEEQTTSVASKDNDFKEGLNAKQYSGYKVTQEPKKSEMQYIAVSDLHGNMDKWNSVKNLIQTNPNVHIYMLGDAMDRGEFGPEILLQIKELSDEGKITYLPGNHDIFAYEYLDDEHPGIRRWAQLHLEANGGRGTMNKLDNFEKVVAYELTNGNIKKAITREELREWLGKQPIQIVKPSGEYTYAMAHALFDLELYKFNKRFNLSDALRMELSGKKDGEMYRRYKTAMWYRQENEKDTKEYDLSFPAGWVAIVGHTPQPEINLKYIENNPAKPMICIDKGNRKLEGYNLTTGQNVSFEDRNIER